MSRMDISDSSCVLCNQEIESVSHLFSKCQVAKALWFSTCWGFIPNEAHLESPSDLIKAILEPLPPALCQALELWQVSLNMAITLEEIWFIRNEVLHHKGPVDLQVASLRINAKFSEYCQVFSHFEAPSPEKNTAKWAPPPMGTIKMNVDAALSQSNATLAIIARDNIGVVIKVWTKIIPLCSPLLAKTEAILWALYLAFGENWRNIIVESDLKFSIDTILDCSGNPRWTISTKVFDIKCFAKSFSSCFFFWINRSGNSVAHATAKYALACLSSLCLFTSNLPTTLASVCEEDASALSVSF